MCGPTEAGEGCVVHSAVVSCLPHAQGEGAAMRPQLDLGASSESPSRGVCCSFPKQMLCSWAQNLLSHSLHMKQYKAVSCVTGFCLLLKLI